MTRVGEPKKELAGKLMAVIADEDTCVGFLLGGVGQWSRSWGPNLQVIVRDTTPAEIEKCFKYFVKRTDIDVILISKNYADLIRNVLDNHKKAIPIVLEIPPIDCPNDLPNDTILNEL